MIIKLILELRAKQRAAHLYWGPMILTVLLVSMTFFSTDKAIARPDVPHHHTILEIL